MNWLWDSFVTWQNLNHIRNKVMTIQIPIQHLRKHAPDLIPEYYKSRGNEFVGAVIDVTNAQNLSVKLLETLNTCLRDDYKNKVSGSSGRCEHMRKVLRYHAQPEAAERTVSDLDDMEICLKDVIASSSPERHWIYREMEDGMFCPAYVANMRRVPYRRDEPAHIIMTLVWMRRGKTSNMDVFFYRSDISELLSNDSAIGVGQGGGQEIAVVSAEVAIDEDEEEMETKKVRKTGARKVKRKISEILQAKKLALETEEFYDEYKKSIPIYSNFQGQVGKVVRAEGQGLYMELVSSPWRDEPEYTVRIKDCCEDGIETDMVLDDTNIDKIPFKSTFSFWSFGEDDDDTEYQAPKFWEKKSYSLPFHPYVLAYDLRKHYHVWIHAFNIKEREYEKDVLNKLVISDTDKNFLTMLMSSADVKMEDIVKGKAGGIFVLSEGPPGTGKTLTAELYSEAMKRPLYTVQCSQLGIDPDDIEKRLRAVLRRSQRWGAVLLLDEADVYIRSRATDVRHNAIVGVMLRVIEYYSGLMFMTTNLKDIDDAICSRATAHVIYKAPGVEKLKMIWTVLSKQFGLELNAKDILALASEWPDAVGRDVKNLIKLARLSSVASNQKPTAEIVKMVSNYLDMEGKKATKKA